MPRRRTVRSLTLALLLAAAGTPAAGRAATPSTTSTLSYDDALASVGVPGFAGAWVEGRTLVVYLTDPSAGAARAARTELARLLGRADLVRRPVEPRPARYTFRQLKGWHDALLGDVLALPGALSADVDERANVVRFGFSDVASAVAPMAALSAARAVPAAAVELVRDAPATPTSLRDPARPLAGGVNLGTGKTECTLGFPAVSTRPDGTPAKGFVTVAHCTNVNGATEATAFLQPYPSLVQPRTDTSLVPVGVETSDPLPVGIPGCGTTCRHSDSAFVSLFDDTNHAGGAIARPPVGSTAWNGVDRFRVTAAASPVGGDTVTSVGVTSGRTSGGVTATCVTRSARLAPHPLTNTFTLRCQMDALYSSIEGDSGGPVFIEVGGDDVTLAGINWAKQGTGARWTGIFSPISGIVADLGPLSVCAPGFGC